jgi:hypothetical protein
MGKRGPKPQKIVNTKWSANLAYAIGLIATDGCLSNDGRHITLVSKDQDQIINFMKSLNIKVKIGDHISGYNGARAYRCQFGDIYFYNFLVSIGITPNKSKTINSIKIPNRYFFDFLRGCLDGDGYTFSYWDSRWKSSFMLYTGFASASEKFILWLRYKIYTLAGLNGHITYVNKKPCFQLKYAKKESIILLNKIYENNHAIYLKRKRLKINEALGILRLKI